MENDKILSMLNTLVSLKEEMSRNNIDGVKENDMLYTLTFISLIRNGMDFNIISKVIGEKEEKKAFISFSASPKEKEVITKDYVEVKTMMGDFNCSVENIKKYLSEKEYKTLILKLSDKPAAAPKTFAISDYDETLGVEEMVEKEAVQEEMSDDEPAFTNNASRLPHFYEDKKIDPDYPGKKYLSTMLCHTHVIDITKNKMKFKAIFTVFPVKITAEDPATDIAVAATIYNPSTGGYLSPRGGVSRGTSASVNIEFDETVFVVHGAWEKGVFKSYVRSTTKSVSIDAENIIERKPGKDKTSTTFMAVREIPGVNVYVFPAVIGENSGFGYMIGAIAVESPEEKSLTVLTPNSNGEYLITANGVTYVFGAYWQGSTPEDCVLVYSFEEHED